MSRWPVGEDTASKRGSFAETPIGFIHIDSGERRLAEARLIMVLAIDGISKFTVVEFHENARQTSSPCRRGANRRRQLSAAPTRRPHPRSPPAEVREHSRRRAAAAGRRRTAIRSLPKPRPLFDPPEAGRNHRDGFRPDGSHRPWRAGAVQDVEGAAAQRAPRAMFLICRPMRTSGVFRYFWPITNIDVEPEREAERSGVPVL